MHALRKTPLHALHLRLGARMVPFAGWEMPIQYAGVKAEHLAVRSNVGVFDVSHMGELLIRGAEAVSAVNRLLTNDLAPLADGRAVYTCCCNESGTILDDLIVYKLRADAVLVVCNASNVEKISKHFRHELSTADVELEDESDATALLAVQGPLALSLLDSLCASPLSPELRRFELRAAEVAGVACRVARTGYTGEDGVELFCSSDDAPALFEALLGANIAGRPNAVPVGLAARDTLRLEARLPLYGQDIDETTTPFEAGLGWTVKLTKPNFIGKAALQAQRAAGPTRSLVGFEMVGRGIARPGYRLLAPGGAPVGVCTSGSPAPTLDKNIGLGYVPLELSAVGTELLVDCRGKYVSARVVPTPFYRRQ